jgi:circadian clock protein KaiB
MKKHSSKPERFHFQLYVAGDSPNSTLAKANLRAALGAFSKEQGTLEIIDVLRDPERALNDGVLVTPTLIKVSPLPERRAVGNFRDRSVLLALLGSSGNDVE